MTYTVTLAPQFPGTVTTGTVVLTAYTSTGPGVPPVLTTLCTINLTSASNNTGSCTFTPSAAVGFLPTGVDKFTATYSGDANFASGTTGSTTAYVNRSTVTTAVTVNPQNPVYGQYPSFAITVTPAISGTTPSGTVQILSSQTGLTPLCTYTLSTVLTYGSVVGSCTSTQLLVAQNNVTFTAVYSGDTNFVNGTGSTLTNVQKANTTTTVTPTTTNPTYGQSQSFARHGRPTGRRRRPDRDGDHHHVRRPPAPVHRHPVRRRRDLYHHAAGADRFRHRLPGQLLRGHQLPGLDRAQLGQHRGPDRRPG